MKYLLALFLLLTPAFAHDGVHNEWYASLMQPDNPTASCCGVADAYWCDDYYAKNGKAYCKLTDDRCGVLFCSGVVDVSYAGICYDGPLAGKRYAILYGRKFVVPKLDGYNEEGQPIYGHIEYSWCDTRNGWVFES